MNTINASISGTASCAASSDPKDGTRVSIASTEVANVSQGNSASFTGSMTDVQQPLHCNQWLPGLSACSGTISASNGDTNRSVNILFNKEVLATIPPGGTGSASFTITQGSDRVQLYYA